MTAVGGHDASSWVFGRVARHDSPPREQGPPIIPLGAERRRRERDSLSGRSPRYYSWRQGTIRMTRFKELRCLRRFQEWILILRARRIGRTFTSVLSMPG